MSINVGQVEVDVVPEDALWVRRVNQMVARTPAQKVVVDADIRAASDLIDTLFSDRTITVNVRVDETALSLQDTSVTATVDIDTGVFAGKIESLKLLAEELLRLNISFQTSAEAIRTVFADVAAAAALQPPIALRFTAGTDAIKEVTKAVLAAERAAPAVNIKVNSSDLDLDAVLSFVLEYPIVQLKELQRDIERLEFPIHLKADTEAVKRELKIFEEWFSGKSIDIHAKLQDGDLSRINRQIYEQLQIPWGNSLNVHIKLKDNDLEKIHREIVALQDRSMLRLVAELDLSTVRLEAARLAHGVLSIQYQAELRNNQEIEDKIDRLTRDRRISIDIAGNRGLLDVLGRVGSLLGTVTSAAGSVASALGVAGSATQAVTSSLSGLSGVAGSAASGLGGVGTAGGSAAAALGPVGISIGVVVVGLVAVVGAAGLAAGAAAAFTSAAVLAAAVATALGTAASVLAGTLAVLPSVIFGVVGALGVLYLALSPVMKVFSAFQALEDAQGTAGEKAADSVAKLGNATAAAQRQVDAANRNIASSTKAVGDAYDSVKKKLEDLRQAEIDGALQATDAQYALTAAKEKYAQLQSDPSSTLNEIRLGELAVQQAQNNIKKVGTANERSRDELAKLEAGGSTDDARIRASDDYVSALDRQKLAKENLVVAEEALARAREAADTSATSSTDAQRAKYEALFDSLGENSQKLEKVLEDLFKKGGVFDRVSEVLDKVMVPGITAAVVAFGELFGSFDKKGKFEPGPLLEPLAEVGRAIGDVSTLFANMFKDEKFQEALSALLLAGAAFITTFGTALVPVLKDLFIVFGDIASSVDIGPFVEGITGLLAALTPLFKSLLTQESLDGLSAGMTGFFGILNGVIALLGPFIAKLAEVGGPILERLQGPLLSIFESLLTVIEKFVTPELLGSFVILMEAVATAFETLANSGVIDTLVEAFTEIVLALADVLPSLVDDLIPILPTLIDSFLRLSITFIELLPSLVAMIPYFLQLADMFIRILLPFLPDIVHSLELLAYVLGTAIPLALGIVMAPILLFIGLIRGIVEACQWVWKELFGESIFPDMQDAFEDFFNAVSGFWNNILKPVFDGFISIVGDVKDAVTDKFNAVVDFIGGLGEKISSAASGMWDGLKNTFKGVVNWLIDEWNKIDFKIDITVPDFIPGIGGKGFKVDDIFPDIPRLALGGVVTQPTYLQAGEAGPEAIIPLDQIASVARMLTSATPTSVDSQHTDITLNVYNPLPERTTDSLPTSMRRIAAMG